MTDAPTTSTGLKENLAALLCYVLGWVTGIIFLLIEPKNKVIKFHAIQSIIVFGAYSIVTFILSFIPVVGWILNMLLGIAAFISWILLMVKANQGGTWKYPIAGNYAEKYANK